MPEIGGGSDRSSKKEGGPTSQKSPSLQNDLDAEGKNTASKPYLLKLYGSDIVITAFERSMDQSARTTTRISVQQKARCQGSHFESLVRRSKQKLRKMLASRHTVSHQSSHEGPHSERGISVARFRHFAKSQLRRLFPFSIRLVGRPTSEERGTKFANELNPSQHGNKSRLESRKT